MQKSNYRKFFIMLATSLVSMYLVMFLNVASTDHIYLSLTRFYMALLMVSPMALTMLLFMPKMYPDTRKNILIGLTSILIFALALTLLRYQVPIGDRQYMKAMIPHHSSAIMTSSSADIKDPQVRALADSIISSQKREIQLMKAILSRMENKQP